MPASRDSIAYDREVFKQGKTDLLGTFIYHLGTLGPFERVFVRHRRAIIHHHLPKRTLLYDIKRLIRFDDEADNFIPHAGFSPFLRL